MNNKYSLNRKITNKKLVKYLSDNGYEPIYTKTIKGVLHYVFPAKETEILLMSFRLIENK